MKPLVYAICLTFLVVACHSDVFPNDSLYQRWQLVRYRQGTGPWITPAITTTDDTEYRPDGTLVYRRDGQIVPIDTRCCAPSSFKRLRNEIMFDDYIVCAFALCVAPSKTPSTITQLTDDLLELTHDKLISQYKSVK